MLEKASAPAPESYFTASRLFSASLILSFAFTLLHILSLPLVVSYDGYLYIQLADMVGTSRVATEWDYLRTPLFPILLKLSFKLLGRQALAVICLNSTLYFLGIWLLGSAIKNTGRPLVAAWSVVVMTLYPGMVAYSHCVLSESGTFFFVALLAYLMVWNPPRAIYKIGALAATLLLGFYYRPTILYLSPLFAALLAWLLWCDQRTKKQPFSWRPWLQLSLIVLIPFVGSYPWTSKPEFKQRMQDPYYFGASKQVLIDPTDPILGNMTKYYSDSIHQSMNDGHLDFTGLLNSTEYAMVDHLKKVYAGQSGPKVMLKLIAKAPRRYAAGVMRCMIVFCGYPTIGNDNVVFINKGTLHPEGSTFLQGTPAMQADVETNFARKTDASLASVILGLLVPIYTLAVFLASILTVVGFVAALWKRDMTMLMFTGLPLLFFALHAMLLMSVDRLVMPVYPWLLANLILLPGWLNSLRSRNQVQIPASSENSNLKVAQEQSSGNRAFYFFLGALALLVAAHIFYSALSHAVPGSDESHYMSGVLNIVDGFKTGGLAGGWQGYIDALTFKTQFICVPAALILLITGNLFLSCSLSMILCFAAVGLASYSFFRNLFSPSWSAVASLLLLTMPLVNGLTHRFYVENYMLLFSMLLLDILIRHGGRSFLWCAIAGLVLGCGLMVKSSFALFVALPCAYLLYEETRIVFSSPGWPREFALLFARLSVLAAMAVFIAYPPYSAHWQELVAHVKLAGSLTECIYPEVTNLFLNISNGPHFLVFCIALAGTPALIDAFPELGKRERSTWIVLLLVFFTTLYATTTMVVKTTRYTSPWLPIFAAMAVMGLRSLSAIPARSLKFGIATVLVSTVLCMHNSFAILPIPDLRAGPLRILSSSFHLNCPNWMDDNHPVERRDFLAPLFAAEAFIASDAKEKFNRPVNVADTVHGLFITHDTMSLLAKAQHNPVSYAWWPAFNLNGGLAPDYILEVKGHRELYVGTHYYDYCPNLPEQLKTAGVQYDLVKEIEGPSNSMLRIHRKK